MNIETSDPDLLRYESFELPKGAPNLLHYGSFERCSALLDYIEDEYNKRDGESIFEWLERMNLLGEYFWREVAYWWPSMDAIEHENMAMFFEYFGDSWGIDCMANADQRSWKCLPRKKQITIYRGQDLNLPVGLAWTTDRKKAEWFANAGLRGYRKESPVILTAKVWKGDVVLCLGSRGEKEIVPFFIPIEYTVEHLTTSMPLVA